MLLPSAGIVKALFYLFSSTDFIMIDSSISQQCQTFKVKGYTAISLLRSDFKISKTESKLWLAGCPNEMFLRGSPQAGNQQRKSVSIHLATLTVLSPGSILENCVSHRVLVWGSQCLFLSPQIITVKSSRAGSDQHIA